MLVRTQKMVAAPDARVPGTESPADIHALADCAGTRLAGVHCEADVTIQPLRVVASESGVLAALTCTA
jgi:hypothetical protein